MEPFRCAREAINHELLGQYTFPHAINVERDDLLGQADAAFAVTFVTVPLNTTAA